jgi:hypothetical protein
MPKRHNAKLCPFSIRERIVDALANGDSKRARALRVSTNTVAAIVEQESQRVESRKARIAAQCERNATLAAELINQKLESKDDIPLSTLVPVFGVAVDKLTILRGDPSLTIHHQHSRPTQQELIDALHALNAAAEKRAKAAVVEVPEKSQSVKQLGPATAHFRQH